MSGLSGKSQAVIQPSRTPVCSHLAPRKNPNLTTLRKKEAGVGGLYCNPSYLGGWYRTIIV
jgi:hypothetical protein